MIYVAAIFLPLLGAVIAGFFGRALGDRASAVVACVLLGLAMVGWLYFRGLRASTGRRRRLHRRCPRRRPFLWNGPWRIG